MLKRLRELLGRRGKSQTADDAPVQHAGDERENRVTPEVPVHAGPRAVHNPIAVADLDPDAVRIVQRLTRFDHTAYLVGGCVRDLLLGRKPKDFDLATSATPRQVKRLFRNSRIIGRRFRLAHVYFHDGKIIEVATFRASDGRDDGDSGPEEDLMIRDDNVFGTPEEDALRRDFTVNQLFYDLNSETVLDHADGLGDLRRRAIRTIGDPDVRFREDPIRILRAIKFAARLDFELEPRTRRAVVAARDEIPKAAPPRILEEILRLCRGGAAERSFDLLRDTSVWPVVLPELVPAEHADSAARTLSQGLMRGLDGRVARGEEIAGGEILAALLAPSMLRPFGWSGGRTGGARGPADPRPVIDEVLRPLAVRLRVSRRDQEIARQILATLSRLVPADRLRPAGRRALARRTVFPAALGHLEVLAVTFGGGFAASLDAWRRVDAEDHPPSEKPATPAPSETRPESGEAGDPAKRRRRSRGGRRRRRGEGAAPAPAEGTAQPAVPARSDLPPVWDDRYFFAALPSVPTDLAAPESVAPKTEEAAVPEGAPEPAEGAPRRKRRRRGGRGRGSRGRGRTEGTPSTETEPAGEDG